MKKIKYGTQQGLLSSIRFGLSLVSALKEPYSFEQVAALIRKRITCRLENFLALCDSEIFGKPESPYGKLLSWAGYSREKLALIVRCQGLEGALTKLADHGVYLDIEEFKGRKPVIRPGFRMTVDASELDIINGPSVILQSSGSRGPGMKTLIGVRGLRLLASYIPLMLRFLEAEHLPVILYYPMPSASGVVHLITFAMCGKPPLAWFAQVLTVPWWSTSPGLKLASLIAFSRLRKLSLPAPRLADINHPVILAQWLKKHCPRGAIIPTFPGSALHLVQTAKKESIGLPPLLFILGGEPITARKRQTLEEAGHRVFAWYSSVETGRLALGCLSPHYSDEMHLLSDRLAGVVRLRTVDSTDAQRPALLFTSIHSDMYKFFLNVETGDEAVLDKRPCGCPWEALGLQGYIYSVRSFEKLTLEGMTYVIDAFFRLVEEELPARCGGTPADYQFTEEEDTEGITRLVVSVSPSLPLEKEQVRKVVLELLYKSAPFTLMTDLLGRASSIIVRREPPRLTRSGKILTLRTVKKGESA